MTTQTTVWHVTPESNIDDIEANGLEANGLVMYPQVPLTDDPVGPHRPVKQGVYVCRSRKTVERYAATSLGDVQYEMADGERFALYKAKVETERLHVDPEWETAQNRFHRGPSPKGYIVEGDIPDPELVTVGIGVRE